MMMECPEQLHVMLVDDEALFTNVIGTALSKEACRITSINTSSEVITAMEKDPPDLVLLDIMMPNVSGHDICRAIRKDTKLKDIYIIFATARTGADDLLKGFECGANDYITKPFRIPEVQARVRAGLRVCRLQKELKLRNQELARIMDENARIIGTTSHDIRSPLSIIINYLSLLGDEEIMPLDKVKEICLQRTYHIVSVVDDFLNLTRLNSGKIECHIEEVDITPIVVSGILEYSPVAKKKNIAMTYDVPDDPMMVNIDPERFHTVIMNLYSNAVKYTPENGAVTVAVSVALHQVIVTVTDTGVGIANDNLEKIFDPFPHVSRGKSRNYDETHTGMGLAIARRLTEKMHGTLHAESDGDGTGSRFIITLPKAG